MGTSIKRSVGIRVACAIAAILIFSGMTTMNILRIEGTQDDSVRASSMLDQIQRAEVAHYKWAANLSNALYAGTEFTGSMDHTGCVLGQWLYSELNLTDSQIESLRTQIEPLHKELHASAGTALGLYANSRTTAQQYYQETIQNNLTTLVGLLDKVVDRGTALSTEYTATMNGTIAFMHLSTVICLVLALIGITSLVVYFLQCVVKPLVQITHRAQPLQEGRLSLDLGYRSKNELGQLAQTLESSMGRVQEYVADIDRVMAELAQGNFDVSTSARYIGDFQPIEEALGRFTVSISDAMSSIIQAEQRVSSHAEQLSSGAQALAQGATEQASAVQELYATVDDLSKSAGRNAEAAAAAGVIAQIALSRPEVSLRYIRDGKEELHTPGDSKLISAIYAARGREFAKSLVSVDGGEGVTVRGFVTEPLAGRGSRAMQTFFCCGRLIKSPLLTAALEEAYANRQMKGKFPGCVLHIDLPLREVDVNVHPAKTVVKFAGERAVFSAVYHAVLSALEADQSHPQAVLKNVEIPGVRKQDTVAENQLRINVGPDNPGGASSFKPHKPSPVDPPRWSGPTQPSIPTVVRVHDSTYSPPAPVPPQRPKPPLERRCPSPQAGAEDCVSRSETYDVNKVSEPVCAPHISPAAKSILRPSLRTGAPPF